MSSRADADGSTVGPEAPGGSDVPGAASWHRAEVPPPEQGQLVQVRRRAWLVADVEAHSRSRRDLPVHKVVLEALDDALLGETLEVVWEHEIHRLVHGELDLPSPTAWDSQTRFGAFLDAVRWSATSLIEHLPLQAPFRGAIKLEEYQLEPVVRALQMPRVNLLIADDVGLGKTVEAGLVLQELLARGRIRRIMVTCPASLQRQWQDEMRTKFSLDFRIVDRAYLTEQRREYGVHVNPWASYPRLITSLDFLKREGPLASFRETMPTGREDGPTRTWDMLIVDEAHNVAPAGRKTYVRDSDRTTMMRTVLPAFEHRLFLTATPHNGFTESFTALLEMLDPLRFARGPELDPKELARIMVRRLKENVVETLGVRTLPKRVVADIAVEDDPDDAALFEALDRYVAVRLGRTGSGDDRGLLPLRFTLTLLKKRLLSSPRAFATSVAVHREHMSSDDAPTEGGRQIVEDAQRRLELEWDSDDERKQTEETALAEAAPFFLSTPDEVALVDDLLERANAAKDRPDTKARALLAWIEEHLAPKKGWNDERLIVFTEYLDTLEYLHDLMRARKWDDRILTLTGGMATARREEVKESFRRTPAEHPVRILLATDAASEGLNLQDGCGNLIHYEIPWNPNKMEQRNGRIDRHGQPRSEVRCLHFLHASERDREFLQVIVDKVKTQRHDLGAIGDVVARHVEQAMLGSTKRLVMAEDRVALARRQMALDIRLDEQIRTIRGALSRARKEWNLHPARLYAVLDQALRLMGHPGLEPADPKDAQKDPGHRRWHLRALPPAWSHTKTSMQDGRGNLMALAFDEPTARSRTDTVLVHLDHPLMKRALGLFRRNVWAAGLHETHQLARTSYRVIEDPTFMRPVMVVWGRLVAIGEGGVRLHEEILPVGGALSDRGLTFEDRADLDGYLGLEHSFPDLPPDVRNRLLALHPVARAAVRARFDAIRAERRDKVAGQLAERAKEEETELRLLIKARLAEIRKVIDQREHPKTPKAPGHPDQLRLFDPLEREQFEIDSAWLRRRVKELEDERATLKAEMRARYRLRDVHLFPLGVEYLLPADLVRGGR